MPPLTNMYAKSLRQTATPAPQDSTRDRILKAAEAIFLEKGFQKATIRDICGAAQANVAAVNYHFQDKEGLYISVVASIMERSGEAYPLDNGLSDEPSPEERLRALIYNLLCRLYRNERGEYDPNMGRFVLEALFSDSQRSTFLIDGLVRPAQAYLRTVIEENMGEGAHLQAISRSAMSLFAQIIYYVFALEFENKLDDDAQKDLMHLDSLADHITAFSLAGLRAAAKA